MSPSGKGPGEEGRDITGKEEVISQMKAIMAGLYDADPSCRVRALERATQHGHSRMHHASSSRRGPPTHPGEAEADRMRDAVSNAIMRDSEPAVRLKAMIALTALSPVGDVACVQVALGKLSDVSTSMRLCAVESLSRIASPGDPQVLSALLTRLDEAGRNRDMLGDACKAREENSVRMAMVRALGVLADEGGEGHGAVRVVGRLAEVGESDADPKVREAARNVLAALGKHFIVDDLQDKERGDKLAAEWRKRMLPEPCTSMREALPLCARDRRM